MSAEAAGYRSIDAQLTEWAARDGDRVYLETLDPPARLTFAELDRACHRVANFLASRGVRPRDRLTLLGENGLGLVVLFLGVQRYGATVNPVNVEVAGSTLAGILHDVEPRLVFCHRALPREAAEMVRASGVPAVAFGDTLDGGPGDDLGRQLAACSPSPGRGGGGAPQDLAVIDYTSGTTARPKGVCLTHEAFFYGCASPAGRFGITRGERVLECRSLAWASPQLLSIGGPLQTGATVVLARKFSQRHFFDWMRDQRVTIAVGVPAVINMLLDRPQAVTAADLPSLRFMTSSAAPLDSDRQREFERRYGIPIVQGCGMTEAGWMAGNPPSAPRAGSIGPAMPHIRARFVDEAGAPREPGAEGELMVSGPQMASAYLVERGRLDPIPQDGFRTGDLGHVDGDGYLYLTGRKKDLIIRGGVNISPLEITTTLLAHPAVAEAATIGVPDAVYGEAVVSFVAARAGQRPTPAELLAHCRARLSAFKIPERVIVLDAIPRNERGKVERQVLLAFWRDTTAGAAAAATPEATCP